MLVAIKSSPAGAGMENLPVGSHCTIGQMHDVLLLLYKDKRTQKAYALAFAKGKTVHVMETFMRARSCGPASHSDLLYLFLDQMSFPPSWENNASPFPQSLFNVITELVYSLLVRKVSNLCCD